MIQWAIRTAPFLATAWLVGVGGCGGGASGSEDRPDAASTSAGGGAGGGGEDGGPGGGGGSAEDAGGGSGGGAGSGGTGACNQIEQSAAVAACLTFAGQPAETGGVNPDGTYELQRWQTMAGSPLAVRETGLFIRTSPDTYLVQGVTDTDVGPQARTSFTFKASGSTLDQVFLCGDEINRAWDYSVLTTAAPTTLRVSNSGSVFVFMRVGP